MVYGDNGEFDHAIEDVPKARERNPNFAIAYSNRGVAYRKKGEGDGSTERTVVDAIEDFNTAIQLDPGYAHAYTNRGVTLLHLSEWEGAKADLTTAKNMGRDIIETFRNNYASVENFERRNDVQLPADIAAMLTPQ